MPQVVVPAVSGPNIIPALVSVESPLAIPRDEMETNGSDELLPDWLSGPTLRSVNGEINVSRETPAFTCAGRAGLGVTCAGASARLSANAKPIEKSLSVILTCIPP